MTSSTRDLHQKLPLSLLFFTVEASEPSTPQPAPKQQTPEPQKDVKPWSTEEIDALIKAVKVFPLGPPTDGQGLVT